MNLSSIDILKEYIKGKDDDKYQILEHIYEQNAKVQFEIKSKHISFPDEISGNIEIAKVLSTDFNQKYKFVKTYYLSYPEPSQKEIFNQKWLVVMRDIQFGSTRVGTGYYNWQLAGFDNELKVMEHKIYIHEMLELEDPNCNILEDIQMA